MTEDNLITGQRGSAIVELALAVPVICSLFVGSMEFSRLGNYKRKLIESSRYAGFELAFRKGESDLEKHVAGEVSNLYFSDIQFDQNTAVVGNFSNTSGQSKLQLNVNRSDSSDMGSGVGDLVLKVMDFVAHGFDFGLGTFGYGLDTNNKTGAQVRIRYKPFFFHFIGATDLLTQEDGSSSNDPNANQWMSLGGDRYYSRFVLTTDPWATTGEDDCGHRVQGLCIPDIITDKLPVSLGDVPILPDFEHPQVDLSLIGPEVVREDECHCPSNKWDYKCHCDSDDNNPGVQNNGNSAQDPAQASQNAHNELNNRKQQLQDAIAQDQQNIQNDQNAISQDQQNIQNDQNAVQQAQQQLQQAQSANPQDPNAVQQAQQNLQNAQNQLSSDQGKLSSDQSKLQQDQNQLQQDQNSLAQCNGQGSPPDLGGH